MPLFTLKPRQPSARAMTLRAPRSIASSNSFCLPGAMRMSASSRIIFVLSVLALGQVYCQAIELRRELDLAAQSAVRPPRRGSEFEHAHLVLRGQIELAREGLAHVDVARRAGQQAAAIGLDALHV